MQNTKNGTLGILCPLSQQLNRIFPFRLADSLTGTGPLSCPSPGRPKLGSLGPGGLAEVRLCSRQAATVICRILGASRPVSRSCWRRGRSTTSAGGRAPCGKVGYAGRGTKAAPEVLRARRKSRSCRAVLSRPFAQATPATPGERAVPGPGETA